MNRQLQRSLLEQLRDRYPDGLEFPVEFDSELPEEESRRELFYLRDHGLCSFTTEQFADGVIFTSMVAITARGLDFLEDDGGLSAILGIVIVKLHADTVRDLFAAKVESSSLPVEKKSALLDAIRKLPAATLQAGTTDLVKMGLDHAPDAVHWLSRLAGL